MTSPFERFNTYNWMAAASKQDKEYEALFSSPPIDAEFEEMEEDEDDEEECEDDEEECHNGVRGRKKLTKEEKNQQREMLQFFAWMAEQAQIESNKRAKKVRKLNPNRFKFNPNSIEVFIARALVKRPSGLHINKIIEAVDALGYVSKSKLHRYNHFSRVLNHRSYLFERVGKATFKLRNAFSKNANIEKKTSKRYIVPQYASFPDIVEWFLKRWSPQDGLKKDAIKYCLNKLGVQCGEKMIDAALEDGGRFQKQGDAYVAAKNSGTSKSQNKSSATIEGIAAIT